MLKIRLMGTKNDITWFKKIMQRHPDKYYRSYVEVKKSNVKE